MKFLVLQHAKNWVANRLYLWKSRIVSKDVLTCDYAWQRFVQSFDGTLAASLSNMSSIAGSHSFTISNFCFIVATKLHIWVWSAWVWYYILIILQNYIVQILQNGCCEQHSTHSSPWNFDLTLGAIRQAKSEFKVQSWVMSRLTFPGNRSALSCMRSVCCWW